LIDKLPNITKYFINGVHMLNCILLGAEKLNKSKYSYYKVPVDNDITVYVFCKNSTRSDNYFRIYYQFYSKD